MTAKRILSNPRVEDQPKLNPLAAAIAAVLAEWRRAAGKGA